MDKKTPGKKTTYPLTCLSCGKGFRSLAIWRSYCPNCKGAVRRARRISISPKKQGVYVCYSL